MKADRGCEKEVTHVSYRWQINDLKLKRCPRAIIDVNAFRLITAYNLFTKGMLPNAGGWLDQSNKFIEAMLLITNEVAKDEQD